MDIKQWLIETVVLGSTLTTREVGYLLQNRNDPTLREKIQRNDFKLTSMQYKLQLKADVLLLVVDHCYFYLA